MSQPTSGGVRDAIYLLASTASEFRHILISPDIDADLLSIVDQWVRWDGVQRAIHPKRDAVALVELIRILAVQEYDVLHLHSAKAGLLGLVAKYILRSDARTIYTPHGTPIARRDVSQTTRRLFALLERISSRLADKVIACSKSEAALLSKWGVQSEVVNNSVCIKHELGLSSRQQKGHLNYYKSSISRVRVVACGRLCAQKDPFMFEEIAKQLPSMDFVWVGDGECRPDSMPKNMSITGWLASSKVTSEIVKADIFISTSRWEGGPLSAIEALGLGKPLLLRNCVGNVDLVQSGMNGEVFDTVREAVLFLKEVTMQPEKLSMMGLASRKKYHNDYTVDRYIAKHRSFYL